MVAVLFAATSWAEWRFLPALDLEESYDSNIDLSSDNETSDFITRLSTELRLEEVSATRTFAASYTMSLNNFRRHSENNYIGHTGGLSWDQQLSRNLSWHIMDTYYRSEEPLEEDPENPEFVDVRRTRNEYSRNMVDTGFTYQFGQEDSVTVSYLDSRSKNTDPYVEDDVKYGPALELEYWLTHRHGFTLGYSWSRIDYENDPSNKTQDFGFGYQWRWSPHTTLHLDYGLVLFSPQDPAEEDYKVHDVSLGCDHDLGPSWALSGALGYYYRDPDDSHSEDGGTYSLTLVRSFARGSVTLSGEGGYRLEYTGAEDRGFTEYRGVSLGATYSISPRTGLYITTSYMHEEAEEEEDTRDETWNVSAGASYQILPWLSGAFELTQRERSSSEDGGEYRDSLILLRLRGTYEWR
ncbi:MAG: porin [Deltaproteobacteria bacterium]|nr:porin [Deltaproteobacteria bacterium]